MSKERFQRTGMNSFYGEFFCDAVVPKDDFLRTLGQVVFWQRFTYKLLKYYKGKARMGRPPYDPAVLLLLNIRTPLPIKPPRRECPRQLLLSLQQACCGVSPIVVYGPQVP